MSMQAFRNSAKPIIYIVSIAFFAWLVFDLSGLSGGTGLMTTTSVGKIDGQSVDARTFQDAVNRATEARRRQSPEPLGLAAEAQIRDEVWERLINERLLAKEYRRLGISVAPEEITGVIRTAPPPELRSLPDFQTEGVFDPTKYERWLASEVGQSYVPVLEEQVRGQLLFAKLVRHLTASVYVSEAALWERFRDERDSVTLGLATVDPSRVPDAQIAITDAEVEQYYRAQRDSLKRPAIAYLSYVRLDRRPIASDTAAAQERAATLRAEILAGTPFAEVARRESADSATASQGGDLGEWRKGQFDPAFDAEAFRIPLNTVSQPVLSRFGYHLIEMSGRTDTTGRGRHILIPIEVAGSRRDTLDARADSLEVLAADRLEPTALDTAARALGLTVLASGPIAKDQPTGLPADAQVWAFQAEQGEHSPVIETPQQLFVFRLDSLQAEGVPPLAKARAQVEARLRQAKRLEAARATAATLVKRAASASLDQASSALGVPYTVTGPFTRFTAPLQGSGAVGAAFGLGTGETSGVVTGRDILYVFTVLRRTSADSTAFTAALPGLRAQALQAAQSAAVQQYFQALRKRAKIVDQRHLIYKTAAQVEAESAGLPSLTP